jgi:hypothetical protein
MAGSGFVLLACDGVWDEMSSEEAVEIMAELLHAHSDTGADIAGMFIEETLKKSMHRIVRTMPQEATVIFADPSRPTLEELRARPLGKKKSTDRSALHDDITVVLIQFIAVGTGATQRKQTTSSVLTPRPVPSPSPRLSATRRGYRHEHDAVDAVQELTENMDEARQKANEQILKIIDVCAGMSTSQLKIVFDALDVNNSGALDGLELAKLVAQVLDDPRSSDMVVAACMEEMGAPQRYTAYTCAPCR